MTPGTVSFGQDSLVISMTCTSHMQLVLSMLRNILVSPFSRFPVTNLPRRMVAQHLFEFDIRAYFVSVKKTVILWNCSADYHLIICSPSGYQKSLPLLCSSAHSNHRQRNSIDLWSICVIHLKNNTNCITLPPHPVGSNLLAADDVDLALLSVQCFTGRTRHVGVGLGGRYELG